MTQETGFIFKIRKFHQHSILIGRRLRCLRTKYYQFYFLALAVFWCLRCVRCVRLETTIRSTAYVDNFTTISSATFARGRRC